MNEEIAEAGASGEYEMQDIGKNILDNKLSCNIGEFKLIPFQGSPDLLDPMNIVDHNSIHFPIKDNSIYIPKHSFVYRTDKRKYCMPSSNSLYYGSLLSSFNYIVQRNMDAIKKAKSNFYERKSKYLPHSDDDYRRYLQHNRMYMYITVKPLKLMYLYNHPYDYNTSDNISIFLHHLLNVFFPPQDITIDTFKESVIFLYPILIKMPYDIEGLYDIKIFKDHIKYFEHLHSYTVDVINQLYKFVNGNIPKDIVLGRISVFSVDKLVNVLLQHYCSTDYDGSIYVNFASKNYRQGILYQAKIVDYDTCVPFELSIFNGERDLINVGNFYQNGIENYAFSDEICSDNPSIMGKRDYTKDF